MDASMGDWERRNSSIPLPSPSDLIIRALSSTSTQGSMRPTDLQSAKLLALKERGLAPSFMGGVIGEALQNHWNDPMRMERLKAVMANNNLVDPNSHWGQRYQGNSVVPSGQMYFNQ